MLVIDLDTDREHKIIIGKSPEVIEPTNAEEAAKMITTDIACLCEALCELIHIAGENKYAKKEDLVNTSIKYLNDVLTPTTKNPSSDETNQK